MKNVLFLITGIFSIILCSRDAIAQTGNWEWARTGVTGLNIEGCCAATDAQNNVYGLMWNNGGNNSVSFGGVGVSCAPGQRNCIVVKYDSAGTALWAFAAQGNSSPIGITTDSHGNAYVFGVFSDSVRFGSVMLRNTRNEFFIVKLSPSGSVLWAKKDGGGCTDGFWPLYYYAASGAIKTDAADNVYVATYYKDTVIHIGSYTIANADPTGLTSDMFIAKYDSNGNVQWARGAGGVKTDYLRAMTVTPSGKSCIAGTFYSPSMTFGSTTITDTSALGQQIFIAMYDASGNPIWAESAGKNVLSSPRSWASCLAADKSENIYLTGSFSDTLYFSSTMIVNPRQGELSLYLVKFDPSQHVSWYKTACSPTTMPVNYGTIYSLGLATDPCGNVWIEGSMGNTAGMPYVNVAGNIIDTARLTHHYYSYYQDPGFVAGFNSAGGYIGGKALQSGFDDNNFIVCGRSGELYLCSDYGQGYLIAGRDTLLDTSGNERFLMAKYKYDTAGCSGCGYAITPNFTHSGIFTVNFTYTGTTLYDSLKWDFGDGGASTVTNPAHTYTASGVYHVCVTVYTICIPEHQVTICKDIIVTTGTANITLAEDVQLFPNPAGDELTIKMDKGSYNNFVITNSIGQQLIQKQLTGVETNFDISRLSPGLYYITLCGTNNKAVRQFVKY